MACFSTSISALWIVIKEYQSNPHPLPPSCHFHPSLCPDLCWGQSQIPPSYILPYHALSSRKKRPSFSFCHALSFQCACLSFSYFLGVDSRSSPPPPTPSPFWLLAYKDAWLPQIFSNQTFHLGWHIFSSATALRAQAMRQARVANDQMSTCPLWLAKGAS